MIEKLLDSRAHLLEVNNQTLILLLSAANFLMWNLTISILI